VLTLLRCFDSFAQTAITHALSSASFPSLSYPIVTHPHCTALYCTALHCGFAGRAVRQPSSTRLAASPAGDSLRAAADHVHYRSVREQQRPHGRTDGRRVLRAARALRVAGTVRMSQHCTPMLYNIQHGSSFALSLCLTTSLFSALNTSRPVSASLVP
jgi:hypothetical protein